MTRLTLPIIKSDPTRAAILSIQYQTAADAIEAAYAATTQIEFSPQDYQDSWPAAKLERDQMLRCIRHIKGQLIDVVTHCRKHCRT